MKSRALVVFAVAFAPLGCASAEHTAAPPSLSLPHVRRGDVVALSREGAHLVPTLGVSPRSNLARRADVRLASWADGETRITDAASGLAVGVMPVGARHREGRLEDGRVVYPDAFGEGAHFAHRVHAEGTEDYVVLPAALAEVRWTLALESAVAGLRMVAGTLELLDATGTPRLRMESPYAIGADGRRLPAIATLHGCVADTSGAGPWGRPVTDPGARSCVVSVALPPDLVYPAVLDPSWQTTGMMTHERSAFDIVRLPNGQALLMGGLDFNDNPQATAELFDLPSKTFAATSSGKTPRAFHASVLLDDGRVLVAGGYAKPNSTATAELYDPATGTFGDTGEFAKDRGRATATKLTDGRVLVVGGCTNTAMLVGCDTLLSDAEVYDPKAGSWSNGGASKSPRLGHAAAALPDASALVVGGVQGGYGLVEVWSNGAFQALPKLPTVQEKINATATPTPDGKVIIAGGTNGFAEFSAFTLVYDVASKKISVGPDLPHPRESHRAFPVGGGVTLVGGFSADAATGTKTPVLFPDALPSVGGGGWATGQPMAHAHSQFGGEQLDNGFILIAGGDDESEYPTTIAEIYGDTCTNDSVCGAGYCTPLHVCAPKKDAASACTTKAECASGNCVDGVCCDTPCLGQCQVCDGVTKGSCSVVKGPPHGMRPACPGAGVTCGGTCDGVKTECAFPGAATACGTCSNGKAHTCDGKGTCPEQATKDCKEYVCGAADCNTSCSEDNGCATGYTCASGKCSPKSAQPAAVCMDDHLALADGSTKSCAPYKCVNEGVCLTTCDSSLNCATGNVCSASRVCSPSAPPPAGGGGGGCGCVLAGGTSPLSSGAGVALGLVLLAFRRAARRRLSAASQN